MDDELKVSGLFYSQEYHRRAFRVTGPLNAAALDAFKQGVIRAQHVGNGLFLVRQASDSHLAHTDAVRVAGQINSAAAGQ